MKKTFKFIVMALVAVLVLSSMVLAEKKDVDINWGKNHTSGHWGFVYTRGLEDEEGSLQTYFNVDRHNNTQRYNKSKTGAYIDDGQTVRTTIGARLGVAYSNYIANFTEDNIFGYRVSEFDVSLLDFADVRLDGTYIFGRAASGNTYDQVPAISPIQGDFALNAVTSIADFNVNTTMLRYTVADNDDYDNFINFGVELDRKDLLPGLDMDFVFANYQEDEGWLYEATADYKLIPNLLTLRAGVRDSDVEKANNLDENSVRGISKDYINNDAFKAIQAIWNRDRQNYNVGATVWYDINQAGLPLVENTFKVDYDSTIPGQSDKLRGTLENVINASLETKVLDFNINQNSRIKMPEADNSYYYTLAVVSPGYDVSLPALDDITFTGKFNFDYDQTGATDAKMYTLAGLQVDTIQNIWRLSNVDLSAIGMLDLQGPGYEDEVDLFKFALMAKYTAPKGVNFRVQYFSSDDYDNKPSQEIVGDRYNPYRWHGGVDVRPGGFVMTASVPFAW